MTILLRTDLESKSEWVESISYDSLRVSGVDFYRLTLNTKSEHNKVWEISSNIFAILNCTLE